MGCLKPALFIYLFYYNETPNLNTFTTPYRNYFYGTPNRYKQKQIVSRAVYMGQPIFFFFVKT